MTLAALRAAVRALAQPPDVTRWEHAVADVIATRDPYRKKTG